MTPAAARGPVSGDRPWIMVDDDGRAAPDDCGSRTRTYRRIQDALDAARSGDRISVCPGRYPESLRIGPRATDVYLATEVSFEAVLVPPPTATRPGVDIHDVSRFEIRGFRIRPAGAVGPVTIGSITIPGTRVCSPAPAAVHIRDAHDVTIRGDRIGSDPACGYRVGIEAVDASVDVSVAQVTDFLARGVAAGPGTDIDIDHSDIRFLHRDRPAALPGSVLDPEATGIAIEGADAARIQTVSVFTRVPERPTDLVVLLWAGISISDAHGPVSIRHSVITRAWRAGIRVVRSGGLSILNTLVRRTYGDGIVLDELSGARIVGDDTDRSVTGIRLGPASRDVLVDHLRATRSAVIDCVDASTGAGTAGTANQWRNATGRSSEPDGICLAP